jgi:hypothetical protein
MRPPLGLIGQLAADLDGAVFDGLPGLAPAVIPKWSIAMYSEVVKQSWVSMPSMPARGDARALAGARDRRAHVRQHVGLSFALGDLVGEAQAAPCCGPSP